MKNKDKTLNNYTVEKLEQNFYCTLCKKNHPVLIMKRNFHSLINDKVVDYDEYVCFCSVKEALFCPEAMEKENLEVAFQAYQSTK